MRSRLIDLVYQFLAAFYLWVAQPIEMDRFSPKLIELNFKVNWMPHDN